MIIGNRGNHRGQRFFNYIGTVKPAAKAGFQKQYVCWRTAECGERKGRGNFKKSYRPVFIEIYRLIDETLKHFIINFPACKVDAFVKPPQMRGSIGMYALAVFFQYGPHRGKNRPFAVGPGNMNGGWQMFMRISECLPKLE